MIPYIAMRRPYIAMRRLFIVNMLYNHQLKCYIYFLFLFLFVFVVVIDTNNKLNLEAASTLRRSLLGYRLEINFDECAILSPSTNSYTYKKPKAGQTYAFMLSAVTCAQEMVKEHRARVRIQTFRQTMCLLNYMM